MGRAATDIAGVRSSRSLLGGWLMAARGAGPHLTVCTVVHLAACAAGSAEPAAAPPAAREPSFGPRASRVAGAQLICQALGPRERSRDLSARGRAQLAASRDGESYVSARFEPAMALLREAAQGGERLAQSVYGQTRFSTLFQLETPRPDQRALYVEALAFWRTAALAEPEDDTSGITVATPQGLQFPLSELPAPWLREAWTRADAWIRCHGLPW